MSHQSSQEHAPGEPAEVLDVIREEISPSVSATEVQAPQKPIKQVLYSSCCECCVCQEIKKPSIEVEEVEKLLKEKEEQLTSEFNERINKEVGLLKSRAEFILQNEQVRASYMLREAHRERQEKISALQTQLECKNIAGLMYVMCAERKKSKMENMAIVEEYTNYIRALQEILAEAQSLILNLSRGYKTAAKVDNEWREKMKKTLLEFQTFIHDFVKGTPESEQYFFDFRKLLKTNAPIVDNPAEEPCTCDDDIIEEEGEKIEEDGEKPWYERVDAKCRPFIMFGDMADFKPPQRREVLRAQKKDKVAPAKWKEYVFHDMFVKAECSNADAIKDEYLDMTPLRAWECPITTPDMLLPRQSIQGQYSRRATAQSVDIRGGIMGSILKIVTSNVNNQPTTKATLLGARDSMEIVSTTKLRENRQRKQSEEGRSVVLNIGGRRASLFDGSVSFVELHDDSKMSQEPESSNPKVADKLQDNDDTASALGSSHNDSLTKLPIRKTDRDHKIHYEKVCPIEKCQRMQVDSFVRSLPAYMRTSPFMHFEQSYDEYEPCSPEQLEILRARIEKKKKQEKGELDQPETDPLEEWCSFEGIGTQTSDLSLPDCTCRGPNPSTTSSPGQIYNVLDLYPMKQVLNEINRECFFDDSIQFDRFKVIGHESSDTIKEQKQREQLKKKNRLHEVQKVLKQHPSLLDIFQANAV